MGLKQDASRKRALRLKAGLTQVALSKSAKRDVLYINELENLATVCLIKKSVQLRVGFSQYRFQIVQQESATLFLTPSFVE